MGEAVWDVVVVGAGPAGAAAAVAALRLRPDARVLVLDRADFPRDKACGDGVAPHAVDVLASLGVPDPTEGFAPVAQLRLVGPRGSSVVRRMRRPAKVVPRRVLDARLVDAAVAAGAELARQTVRTVSVLDDLVVLDGRIAARTVVGADGANGVVRGALGLPSQPAQAHAVAVRGYAAAPSGPPEQLIAMDDAGWPAYAWSFPVGDGTANVGYGVVMDRGRTSRADLVAGLHRLLPEVDGVAELRAHRLPLSSWRPGQPDGRVVLAGDAASLVNPFTGEGIYYAVLSGALAGAAALSGAGAGAGMRRLMARRLDRHLRHTTAIARLAGSGRVVDAGIAAAGRSQPVFDDLVELGLGQGLLRPRTAAAVGRALL